ncbi:uncharacterized protein HMPREF1541_05320 [Cyphellophora europaea CBS 101466]|uniref:Transcriptional coactivator HFI1/ADA1 n=1 Tax=Cyphellophora europaea (strain CBS 101466) TaxID=1220924 RepID=W2RTM6_CYPE1|nr:uncharacterized protein HMPREF1541_05320 [Cyphellophora europaea CBS 101466]ETN39098.1 hypothetical protein HMPREF1541_05320 [Cyphellophora europaea CBS 101466]
MSGIDDIFNPATLARSDTVASSSSTVKPTQTPSSKVSKGGQGYPRIDFEPLYAELKSLIADNWGTYYDALTRFIRGELSANEFGDLCDHFILITPATEHAHNTLICAIILNIGRDSPEPGPAAWVSAASDKTGAASKATVISDASEQRLKAEIMALPARDRRRLKTIATEGKPGIATAASLEEESAASLRTSIEQYQNAAKIRAPQPPASSGTGIKTNWDIEIRKRYTQPLYSETHEFPDATNVFARIVPICYEESVPSGTTMESAELVCIATETYVKNLLHDIYNRVRVNGPDYNDGAGQGVMLAKYKRRVVKEEQEVKSGRLQRDRDNDLLPTESLEARGRKPLGTGDLKLANKVGPSLWNGMPIIGANINNSPFDIDIDEWYAQRDAMEGLGKFAKHINGNGVHKQEDDDAMDLDHEETQWEGAGQAQMAGLRKTLGSLLNMPA